MFMVLSMPSVVSSKTIRFISTYITRYTLNSSGFEFVPTNSQKLIMAEQWSGDVVLGYSLEIYLN